MFLQVNFMAFHSAEEFKHSASHNYMMCIKINVIHLGHYEEKDFINLSIVITSVKNSALW